MSPDVLPMGSCLQGYLIYSPAPTAPSSSHALPSANTGDDDSDIEYIGSLPSSPEIVSVPGPLHTGSSPSIILASQPKDNATQHDSLSQKVRCKQHIVSAPPGQTGIGVHPFLLHIKEHMPWEFSSHGGSLMLCIHTCENQDIDKHGLCKPC
jgi:hypothetical protein